jgi:hypothetical protein
MVRVARPGGTVATYVWDYLDRMEILRAFWDVAAEDDPAVGQLSDVQRYSLCRPDALRQLFAAAGLGSIDVAPLESSAVLEDFDDYWQPLLGGQGTAPAYVASLPEQSRARLRDNLRAALPIARDGRIVLLLRVWAVRAVSPSP